MPHALPRNASVHLYKFDTTTFKKSNPFKKNVRFLRNPLKLLILFSKFKKCFNLSLPYIFEIKPKPKDLARESI